MQELFLQIVSKEEIRFHTPLRGDLSHLPPVFLSTCYNQSCKLLVDFQPVRVGQGFWVYSTLAGFYLGYLMGRSSPPPSPPQKKCPASPPKILLSLQYISNYIEKNHPDAIQVFNFRCTVFLCLKLDNKVYRGFLNFGKF